MKYWGALVRPLTASVESGQSPPSFSTGGGCTAAVGVTDSGFSPGGASGVTPSCPAWGGAWAGDAAGLLSAEPGLPTVAGLAPLLWLMKAMIVAITTPTTTTAMP